MCSPSLSLFGFVFPKFHTCPPPKNRTKVYNLTGIIIIFVEVKCQSKLRSRDIHFFLKHKSGPGPFSLIKGTYKDNLHFLQFLALPSSQVPFLGGHKNTLLPFSLAHHPSPHLAFCLTDKIRSPLRSSPLRSAGPPARMKETKMPSPSSPPTMLKPRPVEPLCRMILRGSLEGQESR